MANYNHMIQLVVSTFCALWEVNTCWTGIMFEVISEKGLYICIESRVCLQQFLSGNLKEARKSIFSTGCVKDFSFNNVSVTFKWLRLFSDLSSLKKRLGCWHPQLCVLTIEPWYFHPSTDLLVRQTSTCFKRKNRSIFRDVSGIIGHCSYNITLKNIE